MAENSGVISVIIPVYNVEKYLNRCVKTVVEQTYKKLEIILIDDGAQDNCPKICDEWMMKDSRIKVIHKKNGGLSDARNVGVECATGEYILFVDSDDYIALDMCEKMLETIEHTKSDIAICSFYWQYDKYRKKQNMYFPKNGIIKRDDILEFWAKSSSTEYVVAWNKLYRRTLFFTKEYVRYPKKMLHEDEFTTFRLLYIANQVVFIDVPLYYYVQQEKSIMANIGKKNLLCLINVVHLYFEWTNKYAPQKRKVMESIAMRTTMEFIKYGIMTGAFREDKTICDTFMMYVKSEVHDYMFNPYATLKCKYRYLLHKLGLYNQIIKIYCYYKGKYNTYRNQVENN